jgi:hypothetical protein
MLLEIGDYNEREREGIEWLYFSGMAICFCFIKLENYDERETGASLNILEY